MTDKLTKQGVRDLDAKYGRPRKQRRRHIPSQERVGLRCEHPSEHVIALGSHIVFEGREDVRFMCRFCGEIW